MKNVADFAALNTKIRVMEREMLKDNDYLHLIKLKNLDSIIEYFKLNTSYAKLFENSKKYNLASVEKLFYDNLLVKYDKIICYLQLDYKRLFKKIFMRYEVENLKVYIRRIDSGISVKELYHMFENEKFSNIDYKKISSSKSMSELVGNLKETDYFEVLSYHVNDKNRLFYMEMSLDIFYFKELDKEMKKTIGRNKENTILEVLGKNSDLLNIQWIYRGLKNYKLSSEELLNYVLLTGSNLNYKDLKKLCYSKNIESLVNQIKESKYGFLFSEEGNFELLMERNVERYIYNLFKNIEKISTMNLNKSISYMHKLEYEMRDVFTVMEAVRYNYNPDELRKMLVRELERR